MGGQGLLLLIGIKILIIMTSLQNIVILGAQGLLMLMGSKPLIKMTRPQKMFYSEVMIIKIFSPIKSRRPWPPISISHLFQQGLFSSWPLLFLHLGCFCLILYHYTISNGYTRLNICSTWVLDITISTCFRHHVFIKSLMASRILKLK